MNEGIDLEITSALVVAECRRLKFTWSTRDFSTSESLAEQMLLPEEKAQLDDLRGQRLRLPRGKRSERIKLRRRIRSWLRRGSRRFRENLSGNMREQIDAAVLSELTEALAFRAGNPL